MQNSKAVMDADLMRSYCSESGAAGRKWWEELHCCFCDKGWKHRQANLRKEKEIWNFIAMGEGAHTLGIWCKSELKNEEKSGFIYIYRSILIFVPCFILLSKINHLLSLFFRQSRGVNQWIFIENNGTTKLFCFSFTRNWPKEIVRWG